VFLGMVRADDVATLLHSPLWVDIKTGTKFISGTKCHSRVKFISETKRHGRAKCIAGKNVLFGRTVTFYGKD
jgi:hypothetical protein